MGRPKNKTAHELTTKYIYRMKNYSIENPNVLLSKANLYLIYITKVFF